MLTLLPGLLAAAVVAVVATGGSLLTARVLPTPLSAVPLALIIGAVAARWLPLPLLAPGLSVATRRVLRVGIVLLGARLSLAEVGSLGLWAAVLVVFTIAAAFGVSVAVGPRLGLSPRSVTLVAVGSAICGNTAILATAPLIRARSRDVAIAVAAITVWGSLAVILLPPVARAAGLTDAAFGFLVGLAVQDTAQVVAAAAAHSPGALDVATVVKLVRNTAMALVLPMVAWWWARSVHEGESDDHDAGSPGARAQRELATSRRLRQSRAVRWIQAVPGFVLGFIAMAGLRSLGVIDERLAETFTTVSSWAILVAVAALGLGISLGDLRRSGRSGFALAGMIAAVLVAVALLAIWGLDAVGADVCAECAR